MFFLRLFHMVFNNPGTGGAKKGDRISIKDNQFISSERNGKAHTLTHSATEVWSVQLKLKQCPILWPLCVKRLTRNVFFTSNVYDDELKQ